MNNAANHPQKVHWPREQLDLHLPGHWDGIHEDLGIPIASYVPGVHGPCPVHKGKDGFRKLPDYNQTGACVSNKDGTFPTGFHVLAWFHGIAYPDAVNMVGDLMHSLGVVEKPSKGAETNRTTNSRKFEPPKAASNQVEEKPGKAQPVADPARSETQLATPAIANPGTAIDRRIVQDCRQGGTLERLTNLAGVLGVSVDSLQSIGTGYFARESCHTTPERDSARTIVGIVRRFVDGSKKSMKGHKRGLTFCNDWLRDSSLPVFVVEGQSDVAAAISLELSVIGRPSAIVSGPALSWLVDLLKQIPDGRDVIVLGENDLQSNGDWPGKTGAIDTAEKLSKHAVASAGRRVGVALPEEGFKDLRSWLVAHPGATGQDFVSSLEELVSCDADASAVGPTGQEAGTVTTATNAVPRSFAGIGATELSAYASQEADWLVDGVFTIDEPLLVGARSKGCKTLQLTDLAVAVSSQTKWMGIFEVQKRRKVLFITGEANYRRIAKHIEKACKLRGLTFGDLEGYLRVEAIEFSCLPSATDQASIASDIQKHGFEVIIVDPLYRGLAGVDSARLSEMGSAIKGFQAACAPAMMILSHHVVKSAAREYGEPPTLEDMTGAGIAESCGQWWLVGRNEKYQWDWKHDLCVQFGGREGQGGGRRILFDENDWTFQVDGWHEYAEQSDSEKQQRRDDVRRDAQDRKRASARALILKAVKNSKVPQSKSTIESLSGAVQADFRVMLAEMIREQTLVQRPYRDSMNRLQTSGFLLNDYVAEYDKAEMLVDVR